MPLSTMCVFHGFEWPWSETFLPCILTACSPSQLRAGRCCVSIYLPLAAPLLVERSAPPDTFMYTCSSWFLIMILGSERPAPALLTGGSRLTSRTAAVSWLPWQPPMWRGLAGIWGPSIGWHLLCKKKKKQKEGPPRCVQFDISVVFFS